MDIAVNKLQRMIFTDFADHTGLVFGVISPICVRVLTRQAVDFGWVKVVWILSLEEELMLGATKSTCFITLRRSMSSGKIYSLSHSAPWTWGLV